jgi:hypothetical protein
MPYIQIQFRRDTRANWYSKNTLLASGEMGIELDTHQFKIGDGHTRWCHLSYGGLQGPTGPAGTILPSPSATGQVLTSTGSPGSFSYMWQIPSRTSGNLAIIKAAKSDVNFNFQGATTIIPDTFGGSYSPLNGTTDTSSFSIIMNSVYTMANLPIIMGTIAYWDDSCKKMIYLQIKFGNSSTTNSVRASIIPTQPVTSQHPYGGPLMLKVEGITSVAFTSIGNVSNTPPLNYAVVISLQLLN